MLRCWIQPSREEEKKDAKDPRNEGALTILMLLFPTVNAASKRIDVVDENKVLLCADDLNLPDLEKLEKIGNMMRLSPILSLVQSHQRPNLLWHRQFGHI
ncbi:hypothetical protein Tco_1028039 [Tanacetum coccineum]